MADEGVIERRTAASGRTGYSEPVPIRVREGTHFEIQCNYIQHNTSPDELSLKVKYWKKSRGNFKIGFPAEFTLKQEEVLKLRDAINNGLAVARQGEEGRYLVLHIGDQDASADGAEAVAFARSISAAFSNRSVLDALDDNSEGRAILAAVQVAVRLKELRRAIEELRSALDSGRSDEDFYQTWCESHSWVFGNAYVMRDSVRQIAIGDSVDHLMKLTANGLRDVFELKRPDKDPLNWDSSHKSYYWSSEASKSIGQCHRYIDALHDGAQTGLRDNPDVVAYHPRSVIVQGRSHDWDTAKQRALHGLNARLHSVQMMTYDQLLLQAQQLLSVLSTEADDSIDSGA